MVAASPVIFYDLLPEPGICPYAQRAWIALVELNVPFVTRFVDKENKSEDFLSLFRGIVQDPNGRGTVPTIIDGDYELTESLPIVEYLDKKYGKANNRLLPDDAGQYGKVKLFAEAFQAQLAVNLIKILQADTRAALAEAVKATDNGLKVLNDFIKVNGSSEGGSFFLGSRYSYAETVTTPFLVRAITVPARVGKYDVHKSIKAHGLDRLGSWVEASLSRPSAKTTGCSKELMVETIGKRNQPLKD